METDSFVILPIRNLKMAEGKEQSLHKVLQSVVPLDNGQYGFVYRVLGSFKNDSKYMCNVCKRILIFSRSVLSHNVHPSHKTNVKTLMHNSTNFPETTSKIPRDCPTPSDDESEETKDVPKEEASVKPGQPVPPGLEDVVKSVCQIQSTFDSFTSGPLIGLEYIVELVSVNEPDAEPRYICLLCEKKGDPRSVMVHVTSYNHYLKYICCFFRLVGNKLNLIPKSVANRSAINTAIIKVAEAIEKHYGRLKPVSAEMETFGAKKFEILREIDEKEHFRESPQFNFLDLVTAAKLEEYAKAPVVNFNTKDMDAKNEEMTKKCLENNQKLATIKSLDKKTDKPEVKTSVKVQDNATGGDSKKLNVQSTDPLATQNPQKKLCIALNKPERSIPGISRSQVQNIDIVIKKEADDNTGKENNDEKDDDVIILPDTCKDTIEVHSLSSVSSRSRSWSRSRFGNTTGRSRSPRRRAKRSRSRDRFGRTRRDSRESSFDRYRRDRDLPSRDRDRRDDRGRRDYDDRRRKDIDDQDRRDDSRSYLSSSRGRKRDSRYRDYRGDSRGRRDDSRGRRGDSRGRRNGSRDRYENRRWVDEHRDYGDKDRRDRMRNPTPDRFRGDNASRRDRNHESEERSHQISEEIKRKNRWNAYKEDLEKLEDDLEKTYKFYQGHPEKHPSYNEEWKAFWNRRYKEIQMSGQDPSKYDFKPEWILFWEKKMKEIHDQKVVVEKETLKRKHNLDDLEDMRRDRDLQDISPPTPESSKDVTVSDIKKTWKALTGSEISAPKRPSSPWENKQKEKDSYNMGMTSQQFFAPSKRTVSSVAPVPPVIHSLRMLSVLEHQIGFQASRVIELLSQSLALEKAKPNKSMTLLQNKDIFLFFEAMKEKLRGQLMAGIVQRQFVSTTRNIIKTIEGMLETNPLKPEIFEPVTIPGVGDVDKVAVAQKIAGALIKMGKTNVVQEELEQLINAVVGMASASSVSADVSSDKFFSQLNIKNSNASSHINSIISSLIQTAQQSVADNPAIEVPEHTSEKKETPKFVDYDDDDNTSERGPSPFSLRSGAINPIKDKADEKNEETLVNYDDDDDDYSFEDVYHAASEKLKKSEENKNPSVVDDNSQTQSSLTSVSAKNLSEVLSSVDSAVLAKLGAFASQQNVEAPSSVQVEESINEINKTLNLHELKSYLNQNQPSHTTENPGIDMSLVESIKDTLVQSFSNNQNSDSYGNYSCLDNRPRERPSLDPRSRCAWDPNIKGLDNRTSDYMDPRTPNWDSRGVRPSSWNDSAWNTQNSRNYGGWTGRGAWEDQRAAAPPGTPWEQGTHQERLPPPYGSDGHGSFGPPPGYQYSRPPSGYQDSRPPPGYQESRPPGYQESRPPGYQESKPPGYQESRPPYY